MSLRLTVRLGTGEEQVIDCFLEGKQSCAVRLELCDDMGDDRNRIVGHGSGPAVRQDQAEETPSLPHGGNSIEHQSGRSGVNIYSGRSGILGHGQVSRGYLNQS